MAGMCAAGLAWALPAAGAVGTSGVTVAVTITNASVQLAPMQVAAGTVSFRIANRSRLARTFAVGGKTSPVIAPGKTALLTVSLPKGGLFLGLSYAARHTRPLSGALTVVDTCTSSAATTVTVQMQEATMKLSQQSVPCGTVTFKITNAGTIVHAFQIDAPNQTGVVVGQGPQLQPGQSAAVTVRFSTKGSAYYRCSEIEHDEQYGESGSLAVG